MKYLIMGVLLLATMGGCCSTTIDTWADRGITGIDYGKANILELTDRMQGLLVQQRESDLDAVFDDILRASKGEIPDVEIDEQWLEEHKAGLVLLMQTWQQDEAAYRNARQDAIENLNQVAIAFEQIKRLRRAWGKTEELQFQVDRLTELVLKLLTKENE